MQTMDERFLSRIGSYLPAWQIRPGDGQPEAAVLYAAWRMLDDTRMRMARLPEKHEIEFLRAWGLEPTEPTPMSAYAALSAPLGETVPAESQFYLAGNGTRLWKTTQTVYAESLQLTCQILESGRLGRLLPLSPPTEDTPSRLFDFRAAGEQRQAARFAHSDAFRSLTGCTVCLSIQAEDTNLACFLSDAAQVRWSLELENENVQALEMPHQQGTNLFFDLPPAPTATAIIADILPGAATPDAMCSGACVSAKRDPMPYQTALCEEAAVTAGDFHPFGFRLEPWRTCYVCCPDAFSLRGAQVTISYTLSESVREERFPGTDQPPVYRPVMRRLPTPPTPPCDVYAQSVLWEYWNGNIWLPIPDMQTILSDFSTEGISEKRIQHQIRWPADAQPCEVQGQRNYWLRWRVTQTDDSGTMPRRIHVPEVRQFCSEAILESAPVEISIGSGLTTQFQRWHGNADAPFFPALGPEKDGWWLRFDRTPYGESLSLFVALTGRTAGTQLTAWESTPEGLHPLMLEDGTDGLRHSGLLRLTDMRFTQTEQFGQNGWWICFRDENGVLSRGKVFPLLSGLYAGAVCLQAISEDTCVCGESALPFQGGAISGVILTNSFGGAPLESDDEILSRARLRRHHLGRGVSASDMAQLIREQFHDVLQAHIVREENRIAVTVLMRDAHQHSAAFSRRKKDIVHLLMTKTVIPTLGLAVEVREPNFYPISAMIWIRTAPNCDFQTDSEAVRCALTQFLNPVTGGFQGNGWRIGKLPESMELQNYLRNCLPSLKVMKILLTTVTPQGAELDYAQVRDPLALPVSGNHTIRAVKEISCDDRHQLGYLTPTGSI